MKYKVIDISENDAHCRYKNSYIGKIIHGAICNDWKGGWVSFREDSENFIKLAPTDTLPAYFVEIKLEEII